MSEKPRLGVVAVVPFWSNSDNLNADSNYSYLRVVLPELERATEDTVFLVFFPDPKYGRDKWVYQHDDFQTDRIRLIPWPYDTAMRSSVMGFDPSRFYFIELNYAPGTYWLHQVEMGPNVYGGYWQSFAYGDQPAIIAQHHYIIHKSLPYPMKSMLPRRWAQMGGSLCADQVVYNSEHTQRMANEAFDELLSDAAMEELAGKSSVVRFGLIQDDHPKAPEAKDHPPVVIYNHRFENYKQPRITFALLEDLRGRHEFEVWATQVAGQKTNEFKIDKGVGAPDRDTYLSNIAVPGINTINSVHETFCISILESIGLGHVVVLPAGVTFPELVPQGYPYLFKNPAEQAAMMESILSGWPKAYNQWRRPLQDHARQKFTAGNYAQRYPHLKDKHVATMNRIFSKMQVGVSYNMVEFTKKVRAQCGCALQAMTSRKIIRHALTQGVGVEWQGGIVLIKR